MKKGRAGSRGSSVDKDLHPIEEEDKGDGAQIMSGVGTTIAKKASMGSRQSGRASMSPKMSEKASLYDDIAVLSKYRGEEDEIACGRFPHLNFCACDIPCPIALKEIKLIEVKV
jgi:hypothetical protein